MGRPPLDLRKGPMTPAERQRRRRGLIRRDVEIAGLVEHVEKVLKQATATEKRALVKKLAAVLRAHERRTDSARSKS
jgi:hypothetical protein